MTGSRFNLAAMLAHARSNAEFDGLDWETLSNDERSLYLRRVEKGYEAVIRAREDKITSVSTKPADIECCGALGIVCPDPRLCRA